VAQEQLTLEKEKGVLVNRSEAAKDERRERERRNEIR
jgi:hypothetical protein